MNIIDLLNAFGEFFSQFTYIEEDSILWNCKTMGNMICGPIGFPFHN